MKAPGTYSRGELWLPCPRCEPGQQQAYRVHYSIRLNDGVFFCLRCHYRGRLSPAELLALNPEGYQVTNQKPPMSPRAELRAGSYSGRMSFLTTYHCSYLRTNWDAFLRFDPREGGETGLHLRRPGQARSFGTGLAWWEAEKGYPLWSQESNPLRLVEGPYDVLTKRDVCFFGILSEERLADVRGHAVILCPDGDVWTNPILVQPWMKLLWYLTMTPRQVVNLVGVEYLPGGCDPDEVPPEDREQLNRGDVLHLVRAWRRHAT